MKKNLVKVIALLMVLLVPVAVFSNGQAETESANSTSADGIKVAPKDGLVCFSNTSLSYFFFVAEQAAVESKAKEYGYDFEATSAEFESVTENNNIFNFISKKPVALVIDPADTDGVIAALNKAKSAGIPVGCIDATVGAGGKADITITFDNFRAGEAAAEKIVELLEKKYGEPKGKVLNAYGIQNNEAIRGRREGFASVMKKYPNIEYIEAPGEGYLEKTLDVALNVLAKYGYVDAMHAPSDNPCMGLYEALKKTGNLYKVGEPGHVILVTIDGEPIAIERIKEGWYDASVNQDAVAYGQIVLEMLHDFTMVGKEVPIGYKYKNDDYFWVETSVVESKNGPMMVIPEYYITKDNADDPRHWGNVAWNEFGLRY